MSQGAEDTTKKAHGMGMRTAALIQLGSRYASIVVQLGITAVLARLVSPAEFGTLAIVTVFTSFFTMFSDMGIGVAVVQFRDLTEEDLGRLFGFSVVLAAVLGLVFCAAALPISWVYGEAELVPLCCVASLSLVCATLNMVPNGIMLRERKFAQIGLRLVVVTLFSGAVGIALALAGFGCYALVLQIVATSAGVLVWNVAACPVRKVSLRFMPTLRRVFSYSSYQFGFGLVNYFNRNLDNLLIGKVAGTQMLGYYDKAYKLTTYPMSSFSSVIGSVIQPYMAEHQDEADVVFACWRRVAKLCSLVGAVVAVAMFCCSEEIIALMYGEQWGASAVMLRALALGVYAQMVANPTGAFFQSIGRTDLMFRCGLVNSAIMVAAIVGGLALGGVDVCAWFVGASFFVQLLMSCYFLLRKGFDTSLRVLGEFVPELAGGVFATALGMCAGSLLSTNVYLRVVAKAGVSLAVLAAVYAATGQLKFLRSFVRR